MTEPRILQMTPRAELKIPPRLELRLVPVDAITPTQTRDPRDIQDFVKHWDINKFEPLRVREQSDGRYKLINGHHRLGAARHFGFDLVQVFVET